MNLQTKLTVTNGNVEIENVPSELYGITTAAGSIEQALNKGFLPCGDGCDYVLTPKEKLLIEMGILKGKVELILSKVLTPHFVYGVSYSSHFDGSLMLKIWAACSAKNINDVRGQMPQIVSLRLDFPQMELMPQVFGGNGGQAIYRKPNMEDSREKYLCMKNVRIPFRTPKKEERHVLAAIERFFERYVETLRENKDVLMYQDICDYSKILN